MQKCTGGFVDVIKVQSTGAVKKEPVQIILGIPELTGVVDYTVNSRRRRHGRQGDTAPVNGKNTGQTRYGSSVGLQVNKSRP